MTDEEDVGRWIKGDESASEMLARVFRERPLLVIPPLHRVPLRLGNVVEIVGPSPSAKTHILLQASVNCILPKEWKGVNYGGLERMVMFVDLDCRFDVLRLAQILKHRIIEASAASRSARWEQVYTTFLNCELNDSDTEYDKELIAACMRRFLYIRCYSTSEFLATLKTLHHQLQKKNEAHGTDIHFLMIDSIGAFYWTNRSSASLAAMGSNRFWSNVASQDELWNINNKSQEESGTKAQEVSGSKDQVGSSCVQNQEESTSKNKGKTCKSINVRTTRRSSRIASQCGKGPRVIDTTVHSILSSDEDQSGMDPQTQESVNKHGGVFIPREIPSLELPTTTRNHAGILEKPIQRNYIKKGHYEQQGKHFLSVEALKLMARKKED